WGGYRLEPERIEFWQSQSDRLHDRFEYTRDASGKWVISRLAP
ncbi:MAG TPA: pyridoxamine 5'-phosphate oxidase, partial [Gammaproteobacteria bacterium]|nr:pyridoxamine 5'-phosphate oxidase [Gammaproteobacteria bacterium]